MPDFAAYDQVVDFAIPVIADLVYGLRLRERIADYLSFAERIGAQNIAQRTRNMR
jgi:hypothetical protein